MSERQRQRQAELGLVLSLSVRGWSPPLGTCVFPSAQAVNVLAFAQFLHQERALSVCPQESPTP